MKSYGAAAVAACTHYCSSWGIGEWQSEGRPPSPRFRRHCFAISVLELTEVQRFSTYYMYMRMHFWVHDVRLTTFCRYGAINPFNFLEGMNYVYPRWLTKSYLTRDSLMDYIQKLHSIPSQLVEIQVLMNLAVQLNRTNFESSMVWTGGVIERECFCLLLVEKGKIRLWDSFIKCGEGL